MNDFYNYLIDEYIEKRFAEGRSFNHFKDYLKSQKPKMSQDAKDFFDDNYAIEHIVNGNKKRIYVKVTYQGQELTSLFCLVFDKNTNNPINIEKTLNDKFPRTPHIKGSRGTSDDIYNTKMNPNKLYIATEKMDGSNITKSSTEFKTRSGNKYVKGWTVHVDLIHKMIKNKIPKDIEIFVEFLQLRKGIKYENLPAPIMMFGAQKNGIYLSHETCKEIAKQIGIPFVKEFSKVGTFDEVVAEAKSKIIPGVHEGFVVREINEFPFAEYHKHVIKYVDESFTGTLRSDGENGYNKDWFKG